MSATGKPDEYKIPWDRMSVEVEEAVTQFVESAGFSDDGFAGGPYAPEGYLERYFDHWLRYNYGIKYTLGSFTLFIEVTMWMTEIVMHYPDLFSCSGNWSDGKHRPRHVVGIFDPNYTGPICFNLDVYEKLKFLHVTRHADEVS